jgi:hypothetical protein
MMLRTPRGFFLLPANSLCYPDGSMAQRCAWRTAAEAPATQTTSAARHEPASPIQIGDTQ